MRKSTKNTWAAIICPLGLLGILVLGAAAPAIGASHGPRPQLTVVSDSPGFEKSGTTYYGVSAELRARLLVPEGLTFDASASTVAGTGIDAVAIDTWAEVPADDADGAKVYEASLATEEAVSGARAHVVVRGEEREQAAYEVVCGQSIAIDEAAPILGMGMSQERGGSDGDGVDYYAKEGLTCELTVDDETFTANKVLVNGAVLEDGAWTSDDTRHSAVIECGDIRQIRVEATDGVGNVAKMAYGDEGTVDAAGVAVVGHAFAVDAVVPGIESNLISNDGAAVYSNEASFNVTVRIHGDGLFEEAGTFDCLSVSENGQPAEGWDIAFVQDEAGKRSEAVLSKAFTGEGSYDIAVTLCKTWCKQDLTAGTLVIDRASPQIDVAWDTAEPADGAYVSTPQAATVTVGDEHYGGDLGRDIQVPEGAVVVVDPADPFRARVSFPVDGRCWMKVTPADLAGNAATYESPEFTVDTRDPVVSVEWSGPNASPYASSGLEFYAGNRSATVHVEEENFDRSLVRATGADGSALGLEWLDERTARVSFAAEGMGSLRVEAEDLAGRSAQPYESAPFVIDVTPPRASVVFDGAADPSGAYFAHAIGATITVEEMNFDESLVEVTTVGDEGSVSDVAWSVAADGSHVGRLSFSNSASAHAVTVAGVDLAGNKAQVTSPNGTTSELYASGDFYVDDEVPTVSFALSASPVATDGGVDYFDAPLTVTVTAVDDHFDTSVSSLSLPADVAFESAWRQSPDDPRVWQKVVTFDEGQDQSLEANVCDLAGNEPDRAASQLGYGPFVVDQTAPVTSVSFDNDDARNVKYYNAPRTASVIVADKNFDDSRVTVETNGVPASWSAAGDAHTLLVSFAAEGACSLSVSGTDKCGNQMTPYAADEFVIDLTAPTVSIEGVADGCAYNGTAASRLVFSDEANPDLETVAYSLTGAKRGAVDCAAASSDAPLGCVLSLADFSHEATNDDVYTLEATMSDLAGNETKASATFSVNRFGSTFRVMDADVFGQAGGYLASPRDVVIEEINVSGSELGYRSVSITRDLDSWSPGLTERSNGKGFSVEEVPESDGVAGAWSVCRYVVPAANFDRDGAYNVAVGSEDRAGNINASSSFYDPSTDGEAAAEASFVLDTTDPEVSGLTVRNGETYQSSGSYEVSFTASDNIAVASVSVLLDGQEVPAAADGYGGYTLSIEPMDALHDVEVRATDRAGRSAVARATGFRVTCGGDGAGGGLGPALTGAVWLTGLAACAAFIGWAIHRSAAHAGGELR